MRLAKAFAARMVPPAAPTNGWADALTIVAAMPARAPWIVAGINDRAQLSEAALRMNALIVRGHQLNGVTIQCIEVDHGIAQLEERCYAAAFDHDF